MQQLQSNLSITLTVLARAAHLLWSFNKATLLRSTNKIKKLASIRDKTNKE